MQSPFPQKSTSFEPLMEKDQDHLHHSSVSLLKQQEQDHQQQQQEEEEHQRLKIMRPSSAPEEAQQNQPKKEHEEDLTSSLHETSSSSSDKTQTHHRSRSEEAPTIPQAEGGGRRKDATNNTSITSPACREGRERLQRHRDEVAGKVWIPDVWGQEDLLKDWIDCSQFDACLVPTGVVSARAALVHQATPTPTSSPLSTDQSTRPAGPPS